MNLDFPELALLGTGQACGYGLRSVMSNRTSNRMSGFGAKETWRQGPVK